MTAPEHITTWTTQEVVSVLRTLANEKDLPEHLITAEITAADSVRTLGIDSLGQVYLIERLEEMTGVLMPDDFLDVKDNIAAIAERLNQIARGKK